VRPSFTFRSDIPGGSVVLSGWSAERGPTFASPVTCFELKTGFGLRIGWLFLRHSSGSSKYSEITELYVWPSYRRMKLGKWLESAATDEARNQGSSEIRLLMNEADAVIGPPGAAARKFADACGYGSLRPLSSCSPAPIHRELDNNISSARPRQPKGTRPLPCAGTASPTRPLVPPACAATSTPPPPTAPPRLDAIRAAIEGKLP
jgi:GNAT superfamily N-acetyltransferase